MKKIMMVVAILAISGCCGENHAQPTANVGTYVTKKVKIVRKYDLSGDHFHTRHVDIAFDNKVHPYLIPTRLDKNWWANLVEGRNYNALLESKQDGDYLWSYEEVD